MNKQLMKLKSFAVAAAIIVGFTFSAQADDVRVADTIKDVTNTVYLVNASNAFGSEYNPFALPNTISHWISNLGYSHPYTNSQGKVTSYTNGNNDKLAHDHQIRQVRWDGYQNKRFSPSWFLTTNTVETTNEPIGGGVPKDLPANYYSTMRNSTYKIVDNMGHVKADETCLARIKEATEKLTPAAGSNAEIGKNVTLAICEFLLPYESDTTKVSSQGAAGDAPFTPHTTTFMSNLCYQAGFQHKPYAQSSWEAGGRLDGKSWQLDHNIIYFNGWARTKTVWVDTTWSPEEMVEKTHEHFGYGFKACLDYLDKVPSDWTGTYRLAAKDDAAAKADGTDWPMFDEDVYLDRGDVLLMKFAVHAVDTVLYTLDAYKIAGASPRVWKPKAYKVSETVSPTSYKWVYDDRTMDEAWTNRQRLVHWQEDFKYNVRHKTWMRRDDTSYYNWRMERLFHGFFHDVPSLMDKIEEPAKLASARESFLAALEAYLDADAFIFGRESATGHTIVGKRNNDQLHLFEMFEEMDEDDGGERNAAGWRTIVEQLYASVKNGTTGEIDLKKLGKQLAIHTTRNGAIDFSDIGPNKDGKVEFDMNAFFDPERGLTRHVVKDVNACVTSNGCYKLYEIHELGGNWSPPDYQYYVGNVVEEVKNGGHYYVKSTHTNTAYYTVFNLAPNTIDATLGGIYPSGAFIEDMVTMKARYPSEVPQDVEWEYDLRRTSEFSRHLGYVANRERAELEAGESTNLVAGIYTAAPATDKAGGVFKVYTGATLTGTDVTFENNEVSGSTKGYGGAIYTSGTIAFTNATFRNNKAEKFGGAIDYHGQEKDGAKTILTNVTFADNTAEKGAALSCQGDNLSIDKATFTGNTSSLNGGAIIIMNNHKNIAIANASFSQNTSGKNGGAIEIGTNAELTLSGDESGTLFEGNSAVNGGALYFEGGSKSVTFEDAVTFTGNTATEKGGAIYSAGMINMANTVTLETETDTIYNAGTGTLNWNLADGKAGCLNGYDKLENDGTLQITIDDAIAAPTNIVIATGDFSIIAGKDTFTITNASSASSATTTIDGSIAGPTGGTVGYKLVTEAAGETTNLVLQVLTVDPRVIVTSENSPYEIKDCTYTTVPTTENGGAAVVDMTGTLIVTNVTFKDNRTTGAFGAIDNNGETTLKDVTFSGNYDKDGDGAVYNGNRLNFDGFVTLETVTDKLVNDGGGTLNWNLTGGNAGVLNGYEKMGNYGGTLQITVENYAEEANEFVIATGDFSDIDDKKTFVITNGVAGGAATTVEIDGDLVIANGSVYELTTEEDLGAEPPTTNLVFTVIQPDMSHVIVNSNLAGKYKLGEEVEIEGETYYYGINCFDEIPHDGSLEGTETLEIAGGSASITNEVALKKDESGNPVGKLFVMNRAVLSIMGEGSITNSLSSNSIDGDGMIYVDYTCSQADIANYRVKCVVGSTVTIDKATVNNYIATEPENIKDKHYTVDTETAPASPDTGDIITSDIAADGNNETTGMTFNMSNDKNLVIAGSLTAKVPNQTLKLAIDGTSSGNLSVNGPISGFESIVIENKNTVGKMMATSTIRSEGSIAISNDGHIEAKVIAGGNIDINNTSANTLIGEYSGQDVYVTNTTEGVAQDITLQAYGTDKKSGNVTLYGEPGSVYSNVVLVAGKNATPENLSVNDGSGFVFVVGTNTLSGTVLARAGKITVHKFDLLRLENADAILSVSQVGVDTEIYGDCNIASNDLGTTTFSGNLTLKDGTVFGGKTRLASSCKDEQFILEGTVTLKDGAEVSRENGMKVPSDVTLKLQGATLKAGALENRGTIDIEAGVYDVEGSVSNYGRINLKGGELTIGDIANKGVLNWDLTAGTTTLDWSKVSGSGIRMVTVSNAVPGTSYMILTNDVNYRVPGNSFTVTNSVTGGAAVSVNPCCVTKVGGQFWYLDYNFETKNMQITAIDSVKLTDVAIIDPDTGATNATGYATSNNYKMYPDENGVIEVPKGMEIKVVYTAADDLMFGPGWQQKTVNVGSVTEDTSMTETGLKPETEEQWVDEREIALDTRERIVVGDPSEVLPVAYSPTNWGAVAGCNRANLCTYYGDDDYCIDASIKTTDGYYDWQLDQGLGKYKVIQSFMNGWDIKSELTNYVYYSTYFPLSWTQPAHGTIAVTLDGAALSSPTNVLGYSYLNLAATPTYTGTERYEFTEWTVKTNGVADGGLIEAVIPETRFEMPNAATELAAGFQWKSNYTEMVNIKAGETWQVFAGETYSNAANRCAMLTRGHVFGEGASFSGTKSSNAGAGCYASGGTFAFTNVTFSGNQAANGGAMLISSATGSLVRCTLAGNTAEEKGGAVYLTTAAKLLLEDSTFDGNSAAEAESGALYIDARGSVVSLRGVNTFKTAKDAIANEGELVWDFADNGEPLVDTAANITNSGTLKIAFPASHTNGVYTFLSFSGDAVLQGATDFTISNGEVAKSCTPNAADWTCVGDKRFKITDENGVYNLFAKAYIPNALVLAKTEGGTIAASTNGIAIASGVKVYPDEEVQLTFTPSNTEWQVETNTLALTETNGTKHDVTYFTDVTLAGAKFIMVETNATVSVSFVASDSYKLTTSQAITNAANDAIAAINGMNLSQAEKDGYIAAIKKDRDDQVAVAVGATLPKDVAAALTDANDLFDATKRAAQAYANQTWTIESVVAYTNIAGTVTVTNESQARLAVEVVATTNLYWQFVNWTGVDAEGTPVQFSDATASETTFTMPETNVTVTANFIVSEEYKEDSIIAASNAVEEAKKQINALHRLTDEEKKHACDELDKTFNDARDEINGAEVPKTVADTLNETIQIAEEDVKEAEEKSDSKSYDMLVADNFELLADEGSYDPISNTFTVAGIPYEAGVNAFNSFREAYENPDSAFTTNVHVYGTQLIDSDVKQIDPWTLSFETNSVLSVGIKGDNSLYSSLTNVIAAIRGKESVIVLGKVADAETDAVGGYLKALILDGSDVTIKTADVTPEKKGEDVEVKITDQTEPEGEVAVVPQIVSDNGNVNIEIDASATNSTIVAGKVIAENGDVTIVNNADQTLTIAANISSQKATIENRDADGAINTTTVDAQDDVIIKNNGEISTVIKTEGNVSIDNSGHIDANVNAGGDMTIVNTSLNTLVGRYEASNISLTGIDGALKGVTLAAGGRIELKGTNVLTGTLTVESGAATNSGVMGWSVTGTNRGKLSDWTSVYQTSKAKYEIYVDAQPEDVECVLASNVCERIGREFKIKGYETGDLTIHCDGETLYPGAKAFSLYRNEANELVFKIHPGIFAVASHTENLGEETKGDGGTIVVTNEAIVGTDVAIAATPTPNWQFNGWSGTYAHGGVTNVLTFAEATATSTTFEMPVGEVAITATFALSETYRADCYTMVTNDAAVTRQFIEETETLTGDEMKALFDKVDLALDAATNAIAAAIRPEPVTKALGDATEAFQAIREEAENCAEGNVRFEKNRIEGVEGEKMNIVVYGGAVKGPTQVAISLQKNTLTFFKAYYGTDSKGKAKRVSFPITLNWDAGDRVPKTIVIETTANERSVDVDKFLTLQIGSEAALTSVKPQVCTVVVHDQEKPTADDTPYVRALAWPANGGRVSGYGALKLRDDGSYKSAKTLYATANRWAVFDGWYAAMTNDDTQIDFSNKITDERKLKVGKDTEYGAGTYFAYFKDVTAVASVNLPDIDSAKGVKLDDESAYVGTVGVNFSLPISGEGEDVKLSTSSLPSGLRYNKTTGCIEGVPYSVCDKTSTIVAKNSAGKHKATFRFVIEALPSSAIGTWNGLVRKAGDVDDGTHAGFGTVQFTAGKTGSLSAKVTTRLSGSRSFYDRGYDRIDENTLGVSLESWNGEKFTATLSLTNDWTVAQLEGSAAGGKFADNGEECVFKAIRNVFGKRDGEAEALELLEAYKGEYADTLYLSAGGAEIGTVSFKVKDSGSVMVKANSQNGKYSSTCSGAFRITPKKLGAVQAAIRSSKRLWATDSLVDKSTGDINGLACDYDAEGTDTHETIGTPAE